VTLTGASVLYLGETQSPLGRIAILCSDAGLVALSLPGEDAVSFRTRAKRLTNRGCLADDAHRLVRQVADELDAYFSGSLIHFTVPLAPRGTSFQHEVWEAVRCVPYGETRTYGGIAQSLGRPRSARAVGHANGSNPIPIIIPCHRLVGSTGSLTGYAGGQEMKRYLIAHERRSIS